jgi:hypothetical protein
MTFSSKVPVIKKIWQSLASVAFVCLVVLQPQAARAQFYEDDYSYDYGGSSSSAYNYTLPTTTYSYDYTPYDYGNNNGNSSYDYGGANTNYGSGSAYTPTPNYDYGNYDDPYNIPTQGTPQYTPTANTNTTNYSDPSPFWTPDENSVVLVQFVAPSPPIGFPIFGAPASDAGFGSSDEGRDRPQLPTLPSMPILTIPALFTAAVDWFSGLISNSSDNAEGGGKARPNDAPTGTIPINQGGYTTDEVHGVKKQVGAKPSDWVGVAPSGEIITSTPGGKAIQTGVYIGD